MTHNSELERAYSHPILGKTVMSLYGLTMTHIPHIPPHIKNFNCSKTNVTEIPELPDGLVSLCCSHTLITKLPELPQTLQYLDCSNTLISELPDLPDTLLYLDVSDCPIIRYEDEDIKTFIARLKEEKATKKRSIERCQSIKNSLFQEVYSPVRIGRIYRDFGNKALECFHVY